MEREKILLQADTQMANINRRDSVLRGRGYSMKLTGANSSAAGSQIGSNKQSMYGGAGMEDLLLEDVDEDNMLRDFENEYSSQLLLDFDDQVYDD